MKSTCLLLLINVVALFSFVIPFLTSCTMTNASLRASGSLSPTPQIASNSYQTELVNLPEGTPSGWWSSVQKDIRDSEYYVTWQEKSLLSDIQGAWQAPNRAQNLRTYFTTDGARVIPLTSEGVEWRWGLSLQGYG